MVAGRGVADDRQVAVVGKGLGTLVDPAVFVQVGELDLSRRVTLSEDCRNDCVACESMSSWSRKSPSTR